jgi:hypothetical protein
MMRLTAFITVEVSGRVIYAPLSGFQGDQAAFLQQFDRLSDNRPADVVLLGEIHLAWELITDRRRGGENHLLQMVGYLHAEIRPRKGNVLNVEYRTFFTHGIVLFESL